MAGLLSRYFGFSARSTDLVTEVRAGFTTFMVMAYIIFVNPVILGFTGVHIGGTDFDTLLSLDSVMPALGLGTYLIRKNLPMPNALYFQLSTWATINFTYTRQNERELKKNP